MPTFDETLRVYPNQCPRCEGEPTLLGTLGNLDHYRCRNCGAAWSTEHEVTYDSDDPDLTFGGSMAC